MQPDNEMLGDVSVADAVTLSGSCCLFDINLRKANYRYYGVLGANHRHRFRESLVRVSLTSNNQNVEGNN